MLDNQMSDAFEVQLQSHLTQLFGEEGEYICDALKPEKLKELYYTAYHLYRDQQFETASYFFRLLVLATPLESKYWKGLGACFQMKQDYAEALNCYICTQLLHRDQPDPYLYVYAADCYFALKQITLGLKALEAARLSAEERQDARILKHVALMKATWSNKLS